MRPTTIRLASPSSAARRTLIPFASRAAAVRLTRASSARVPRRLDTDLDKKTGLALADFDVLAQLALAGGGLRMTDLAARALISRSGMTRRITRLVDEGLVRRADTEADGRGVLVVLTNAGVARLTKATPVHLRGVSDLFVGRLSQKELAVLKSVLDKVTVDCTFG